MVVVVAMVGGKVVEDWYLDGRERWRDMEIRDQSRCSTFVLFRVYNYEGEQTEGGPSYGMSECQNARMSPIVESKLERRSYTKAV